MTREKSCFIVFRKLDRRHSCRLSFKTQVRRPWALCGKQNLTIGRKRPRLGSQTNTIVAFSRHSGFTVATASLGRQYSIDYKITQRVTIGISYECWISLIPKGFLFYKNQSDNVLENRLSTIEQISDWVKVVWVKKKVHLRYLTGLMRLQWVKELTLN